MKRESWESEAAMLSAFSTMMKAWGFRVVAEHGGHDLLLITTDQMNIPVYDRASFSDLVPGDVIAVEGKLQASMTLLRQLVPPHRQRWKEAPTADFYVGVVPVRHSDMDTVCNALGIHLWVCQKPRTWTRAPSLVPAELLYAGIKDEFRCFGKPIKITDLDVDIPPGTPSPKVLTDWKLRAVQFCMKFSESSEIPKSEFDKAGIRANFFVDRNWARVVRREGRSPIYQLIENKYRPDLFYPEIADAIRRKQDARS